MLILDFRGLSISCLSPLYKAQSNFQAITDCILEDDGGVDDIEETSGTMTGGVQNNNSELARFVKLPVIEL